MRTVVIAGHFNPLHSGHLQLIRGAQELGDSVVVIVANDTQAELKRPHVFMHEGERAEIMNALKGVDEVVISIDKGYDVCETLKIIRPDVFASGCDDTHPDAIKEKRVCDELGIEVAYNVGGEKINSSSDILKKYYV